MPGVDAALLDPRATWADPAAYDAQAAKLAAMFAENFAQYEEHVSDAVRARRASAPDPAASAAGTIRFRPSALAR